MTSVSSQQFDSYVPVYDVVPDKWEDARPFFVEQLKKMSNAINIREIGWFLDEELLSGKTYFPAVQASPSVSPPQFRQILRKVIDFGPIVIGLNQKPHGITFGTSFTLIQMFASATQSATIAFPIPSGSVGSTLNMDTMNVNLSSSVVADRALVVIEYIQEL